MMVVGCVYAIRHPWSRGEPLNRVRVWFIILTLAGILLEVVYIATVLSQDIAVPV